MIINTKTGKLLGLDCSNLRIISYLGLGLSAILVLVFNSPSFGWSDLPEKDEGGLGEIRYSILTPQQFQAMNGKGWVLMDGSTIKGSDLEKEFGWDTLPDARGVFLRAKDHGRYQGKSKGNPDGDLKLGQYQGDQLASHSHGIRLKCGPINPAATCAQPPGSQYNYVNGNGIYPHHSQSNTIAPTGGKETRPKNITVNVYVKINRVKHGDQYTESILSEIKSLPDYFVKNQVFLTVMNSYIKNAVSKELQKAGRQ